MPNADLARRCAAEAVGTALLLATVVGSGIMGDHLAAGNVAIALLANSIATGGALFELIVTFGPISGAHFNPVVTLVAASQRELALRDVLFYIVAQVSGAFAGVAIAHRMFGHVLFAASPRVRSSGGEILGEVVATFGLIAVIAGASRRRPDVVPFAVASYITGAYWFTSSTSFANPAVTLARTATDTFAGIRPADAPAFIGAQIVGAACAAVFFRWLAHSSKAKADSNRTETT